MALFLAKHPCCEHVAILNYCMAARLFGVPRTCPVFLSSVRPIAGGLLFQGSNLVFRAEGLRTCVFILFQGSNLVFRMEGLRTCVFVLFQGSNLVFRTDGQPLLENLCVCSVPGQ